MRGADVTRWLSPATVAVGRASVRALCAAAELRQRALDELPPGSSSTARLAPRLRSRTKILAS